ncbi:MAG: 1-acyl-sn-glycerol-3-phosphate acyltransferase, partial [Propionicimonas sp.]
MSEPNLSRYTSAGPAVARLVAQQLVMKPYIWSVVNVHTHGMRNLDSLKTPFVVVANHSSHLDAPLIMCGLPRRLGRYLAAGAAADYFFDIWWRRILTALFF